jgi:hydrogenase nickel incorporation protein HypA/HybF
LHFKKLRVKAMHESGPTKKLMECVLAEAGRQGASSVVAVKLKLGAGAGMSPESLKLHFDHVVEGTIAEGAELVVEQVPITYKCHNCGETPEAKEQLIFCPVCGEAKLSATNGDGIELESVVLS